MQPKGAAKRRKEEKVEREEREASGRRASSGQQGDIEQHKETAQDFERLRKMTDALKNPTGRSLSFRENCRVLHHFVMTLTMLFGAHAEDGVDSKYK